MSDITNDTVMGGSSTSTVDTTEYNCAKYDCTEDANSIVRKWSGNVNNVYGGPGFVSINTCLINNSARSNYICIAARANRPVTLTAQLYPSIIDDDDDDDEWYPAYKFKITTKRKIYNLPLKKFTPYWRGETKKKWI